MLSMYVQGEKNKGGVVVDEFAKIFERRVRHVQVAHLHTSALFSPSSSSETQGQLVGS